MVFLLHPIWMRSRTAGRRPGCRYRRRDCCPNELVQENNSLNSTTRPTKFCEGITRRNALKNLGGMIAASAMSPRMMSGTEAAQNTTAPAASGQLPKRPNILWITGEGVPPPALSCYGGRLLNTPNIDRIAEEGVRFE